MATEEEAPAAPVWGSAWSAIARKDAVVPTPTKVVPSTVRSKSGLSTLVVDANAIIGGGSHLLGSAERFFTVQEVLDEVRDPQSRLQLAALPLTLEVMEPDQEAITKVVQFSRATGDLQSLSEVDMKLIALAYTLESEAHGISHLRSRPPPLQVTSAPTHRVKDPPGWGSNVSNFKEWEQLPEEYKDDSSQNQSKILGLKYLNLDGSEIQKDSASGSQQVCQSGEGSMSLDKGNVNPSSTVDSEGLNLPADLLISEPEVSSSTEIGFEAHSDLKPGQQGQGYRPRRNKPSSKPKPVPNIEGKTNVAVGLDASKLDASKLDDEEKDSSDWVRACSRTTRRKFLKREANRQSRSTSTEPSPSVANGEVTSTGGAERGFFDEDTDLPPVAEGLSKGDSRMMGDAAKVLREVEEEVTNHAGSAGEFRQDSKSSSSVARSGEVLEGQEKAEDEEGDEEDTRAFTAAMAEHESLEGSHFEEDEESVPGTDAGGYATSTADGIAPSTQAESEESWSLSPFWQSSIACVTGDFAMQNVILQMGLRLLSPTGVHVRELHRWVLKCTACGKITSEVGRIFCPKCGNGGTLFKVSVTVGANGSLHAGRIRRVNLRGTRYSLPMPKGGREGAAQNPLLREDQLPHKVLHPKQKKLSANAGADVFTTMDTIFLGNSVQNMGRGPQVREAAAIFGGRRNPNERRVTRKH